MKFFILPKLVHLSSLQILFRNATFRIDLVKSRNLLSHANREDALVKDFIILENNFFFCRMLVIPMNCSLRMHFVL